jgi:hypothetical protein
MSPTARTLQLLRREGYVCTVVESWVPGACVRRDALGFGDVLAAHPAAHVVLLVQATTRDNISHRLIKTRTRPELAAWLAAGGRFEIHGWAKRGGAWCCKRVAVLTADGGITIIHDNPAAERVEGDANND